MQSETKISIGKDKVNDDQIIQEDQEEIPRQNNPDPTPADPFS